MGDTSRQIDGFFASEDLFDEVSGTFGELRLRQRFAELDQNEFDLDFRLKLRIPYTKDKLKFLLESDTEERETEAAELGGLGDRVLGEVADREDDDEDDEDEDDDEDNNRSYSSASNPCSSTAIFIRSLSLVAPSQCMPPIPA